MCSLAQCLTVMYLFFKEPAQLIAYVLTVQLQAFSLSSQIRLGAQAAKKMCDFPSARRGCLSRPSTDWRVSVTSTCGAVLAAAAAAAGGGDCCSFQAEQQPKGQRVKAPADDSFLLMFL